MLRALLLSVSFLLLFTQCGILKSSGDDGRIEVIFLQLNDVYEIAPMEGGKTAGMARVATLRKQLLEENPNTITVLAGDFLSPSLIGTLQYEGSRIKGRQMVDVMNVLGVDAVVFGNHEFDLKASELQQRLNESEFEWLGSTVKYLDRGQPIPFYREKNGQKTPAPESLLYTFSDADGTFLRLGMVGLTLKATPADYVWYEPATEKFRQLLEEIIKDSDIQVALTHQDLQDDLALAGLCPQLSLIMGGHDHTNSFDRVANTVVAKADANAKTVYVHRISVDKKKGKVSVQSELVPIDESIPLDPEVDAVVQKWTVIQDENLRQVVNDPYEVVYVATEPLDGLEKSVRNQPTNLCQLITKSMVFACQNNVQGAILNSGSIRIDDMLAGKVLAIDLFRTMPFGGSILEVDMRGSLLKQLLQTGEDNRGIGGYLQTEGFSFDGDWKVQGQPIDNNQTYRIAITDFLMSGKETNMGFLTPDNPGVLSVTKPSAPDDLRTDIRRATIEYMKQRR